MDYPEFVKTCKDLKDISALPDDYKFEVAEKLASLIIENEYLSKDNEQLTHRITQENKRLSHA